MSSFNTNLIHSPENKPDPTNLSAESFYVKIEAFRNQFRGVNDVAFCFDWLNYSHKIYSSTDFNYDPFYLCAHNDIILLLTHWILIP